MNGQQSGGQTGDGSQQTSGQQNGNPQQQQTQAVKDISSNLATALNNVGIKGAPIITDIGAIVATALSIETLGVGLAVAAFLAEGISLITSIVQFFSPSSQTTPGVTAAEFQQAMQQLENMMQQAINSEASDAFQAWTQKIGVQVGNVKAAQQSIPSWVQQLPLPADDVTANLKSILSSVDPLAPPPLLNRVCDPSADPAEGTLWAAVQNYQTYWSDTDSPDVVFPPGVDGSKVPDDLYGYGTLAPNSGNTFYWSYILPSYLYVLSMFASVGVIIDPQFVKNWAATVMRPAICYLQSIHDYIFNSANSPDGGFTRLPANSWDGQSLAALYKQNYQVFDKIVSFSQFEGGIRIPNSQPGFLLAYSKPDPGGAMNTYPDSMAIEFGYVERFSGYSSVAIYTIMLGLLATDEDVINNPLLYPKFEIRLLRRQKDVYLDTGLASLWDTINNLKKLIGDTPLPGPNFGDWSFRNDIAPFVGKNAPSIGGYSVRTMVANILATPPIDVSVAPQDTGISLRIVLYP